ncbi:MAG: hypothetical protein CMJ75_09910 [Planctomycetaceae bacterium]|nr:hypothetical protein [Planctomycetaceae bacterium]
MVPRCYMLFEESTQFPTDFGSGNCIPTQRFDNGYQSIGWCVSREAYRKESCGGEGSFATIGEGCENLPVPKAACASPLRFGAIG